MVSYGRIYVGGVHWPLDVVMGGWVLGAADVALINAFPQLPPRAVDAVLQAVLGGLRRRGGGE